MMNIAGLRPGIEELSEAGRENRLGLCKIDVIGWEPGMEIILTPMAAKLFADEDRTRKRIQRCIVEYARKPASHADCRKNPGRRTTKENHEREPRKGNMRGEHEHEKAV